MGTICICTAEIRRIDCLVAGHGWEATRKGLAVALTALREITRQVSEEPADAGYIASTANAARLLIDSIMDGPSFRMTRPNERNADVAIEPASALAARILSDGGDISATVWIEARDQHFLRMVEMADGAADRSDQERVRLALDNEQLRADLEAADGWEAAYETQNEAVERLRALAVDRSLSPEELNALFPAAYDKGYEMGYLGRPPV